MGTESLRSILLLLSQPCGAVVQFELSLGKFGKGIGDYQCFEIKWAMMNTIANPSPIVMK